MLIKDCSAFSRRCELDVVVASWGVAAPMVAAMWLRGELFPPLGGLGFLVVLTLAVSSTISWLRLVSARRKEVRRG